MKGFKFKLDRLARVRKVQEEIARAAWRTAVLEAQDAQGRCDDVREEIVEAIVDLRQLQTSASIDTRQVLMAREALGFLEERRDALLRIAEDAQRAAEALREPWQALRTELEGLTRLEDKERVKYRIKTERDDAKQLDEQAMDRARRSRFTTKRKSA